MILAMTMTMLVLVRQSRRGWKRVRLLLGGQDNTKRSGAGRTVYVLYYTILSSRLSET